MQPSRIRALCLAVLFHLGAGALAFAQDADKAAQAPEPQTQAQGKKVNINTASAAELAYLPRIGAKVAERIIAYRKEKPFSRTEELMEVKGIGEKLFLTLKPYVAVSGTTTLTSKVRSSSSSSRRPPSPAAAEKPASAVPMGKGW
jgi:competence ComEA-like helix-hairpin-helix protein